MTRIQKVNALLTGVALLITGGMLAVLHASGDFMPTQKQILENASRITCLSTDEASKANDIEPEMASLQKIGDNQYEIKCKWTTGSEGVIFSKGETGYYAFYLK